MTFMRIARQAFNGKQNNLPSCIKEAIVGELTPYAVARYIGLKQPLLFVGCKILLKAFCTHATFDLPKKAIASHLTISGITIFSYTTIYKIGQKIGINSPTFVTLAGINSLSWSLSYPINALTNWAFTKIFPPEQDLPPPSRY